MMFPKPERKKDRKLLDHVKTLRCVVCHEFPTDPDHITTRGAGGGDTEDNVWPLCRKHHREKEDITVARFVVKYPITRIWLLGHKRYDIIEWANEVEKKK